MNILTLLTIVASFVDPQIGSEGEGRVFVGPSMPYGMVKPGPDCTSHNNSGWAPMPVQVDGFSQTHVSGTGGGPKYGNVLIQPFCSGFDRSSHPAFRASEEICVGYYGTTFTNGIRVETTTSERASMYRITYPSDSAQMLVVDAGWFLGDPLTPDARESQQFVASEVELKSDCEVAGFTRIRGGWNNGRAYTVFFHIEFDKPFVSTQHWNHQGKEGMNLLFDNRQKELNVNVGISFVGERKAKMNISQFIGDKGFEEVKQACVEAWEQLLGKVEIDASATSAQKRMFYTGLYHTMLEPVDRTGENPLWTDYVDNRNPASGLVPYYDDFYAIWDTYRTSSPLISLIDPIRQVDIVRSLINIGQRDGYMPDARSGNCNGRTQGGSNAEIVLADAYLKELDQLPGCAAIDWTEGYRQMLKDATLPPGGNQEAEGRGGLTEYLNLGYVPYGIDRSGNRTMEYAFCDYAIAQVAKGLGYDASYEKYMAQSSYWKNLWRGDYEHAGTRGFIMPRAADGHWLDTLVVGHSPWVKPTFVYTPVTNESPWNAAWWGTVFYEATSWEYSLSVPHDVPGLIEQCGGEVAFEKRLDTFFDQGFYNVNNEPSFLTPCLYHWLGRPDRSSDRVNEILSKHFHDGVAGLPGNDDSGAMSSWLVFHMMGLYPNAGTDYYLLHTPQLKSVKMQLGNGKQFEIKAPKLSAKNRYIVGARLNGQDYPYAYIEHHRLMEGGVLEFQMAPKPAGWGKQMPSGNWYHAFDREKFVTTPKDRHFDLAEKLALNQDYKFDFDLRTQHRHFIFRFEIEKDSLVLKWKLPRPNKVQEGQYRMSAEARQKAVELCFEAPVDGKDYVVPQHQLFAVLPKDIFVQLKQKREARFNHETIHLIEETQNLLHVGINGYEIWVNNDEQLPVVVKMINNPVEIDWTLE